MSGLDSGCQNHDLLLTSCVTVSYKFHVTSAAKITSATKNPDDLTDLLPHLPGEVVVGQSQLFDVRRDVIHRKTVGKPWENGGFMRF